MGGSAEIRYGDHVFSDAELVPGFSIDIDAFDEPHIGIAAQVDRHRWEPSPEHVRFWRALGAPPAAIWTPGSRMPGAAIIEDVVAIALRRCADDTPGFERPRNIWGEVVVFDGVVHETEGGPRDYPDTSPHVDFVSPETRCAALFASNRGGTVAWRGGRGFTYRGNTVPSYEDQLRQAGMERVDALEGWFLFTRDARTFMHARIAGISNHGRLLIRVFIDA